MTLQGSGTIRFSDITNEFGTPPNRNIGAYRVSESFSGLTNMPLDDGIPQSGRINFSDFYNKKLNMVVDCFSSSGSIPSQFHFDTMQALETGLRDVWFRVDNSSTTPTVYLESFGSGVATVPIRIRINDDPSSQGSSFGSITFQQHNASNITVNFSNGLDTTINVQISDSPLVVTFSGLIENLRFLDMVTENSLVISPPPGDSALPNLAKGLALRDRGGSDAKTKITIGTASAVSGNNTRVADRQLYPYKPDPYRYPANAEVSDANFVSRYAVTYYNVYDTSNNYAVINNPTPAGEFTWTYARVTFPSNTYYRIKCVVDDNATITIGSVFTFNAGFNPIGSPGIFNAYDNTTFISAGTYDIRVTYRQGPNGPISGGNLSYFALTIDTATSTPSLSSSAIDKCGLKSRYNNLANSTRVIGGFKGKPSSTSGTKVWADVNTTIYNSTQRTGTTTAAFRTGIWDSGTELIVNVGPSGQIYGYGGIGGRGGGSFGPAISGEPAGCAFSAQTSCTLRNYGLIVQGYGGGGGGNGASFTTQVCTSRTVGTGRNRRTVTSCTTYANYSTGGGGGGGRGYPAGTGGAAGGGAYGPSGTTGGSGGVGSLSSGGSGGGGGTNASPGGNGRPGSPGASPNGAAGGENGAAITTAPGVSVTLQNYGQIFGRTLSNINTILY